MADKDFKTIEEQLEILRSRGLTINDESLAKDFLLRNNNVFFKSATFQNIVDIYHFDHEFKHIILQYLEVIEV